MNNNRMKSVLLPAAFTVIGAVLGGLIGNKIGMPAACAICLAGFFLFSGCQIQTLTERRKIKKAEAQRAAELANLDTEKMERILAFLRERSAETAYRIRAEKRGYVALTDSKFGGCPYWEPGREYPTGEDGKKLLLLAQINFEQVSPQSALLPSHGLLQFFASDDDSIGSDNADPTAQKNFRVVYHESFDTSVTAETVLAMGVPTNTDLPEGSSFPVTEELALTFSEYTDCVNPCLTEFDRLAGEAVGAPAAGFSAWDYFNAAEYKYLTDRLDIFGHKILGYPSFTQEDPRLDAQTPTGEKVPTKARYDTLLLQIDSQDGVLWGDNGVGNFFISHEALHRRDFSDVLYTWDCY